MPCVSLSSVISYPFSDVVMKDSVVMESSSGSDSVSPLEFTRRTEFDVIPEAISPLAVTFGIR